MEKCYSSISMQLSHQLSLHYEDIIEKKRREKTLETDAVGSLEVSLINVLKVGEWEV